MADTTYTKTDGIGTFEISIRNCTRAANELLTSGWNSARIDACKSAFAYVHGHTDELPVVDLLALVREISSLSIKCTYGDYSYTIDSVPSIPSSGTAPLALRSAPSKKFRNLRFRHCELHRVRTVPSKESFPKTQNLLSFYEELIEDSDSFTIMAEGDGA